MVKIRSLDTRLYTTNQTENQVSSDLRRTREMVKRNEWIEEEKRPNALEIKGDDSVIIAAPVNGSGVWTKAASTNKLYWCQHQEIFRVQTEKNQFWFFVINENISCMQASRIIVASNLISFQFPRKLKCAAMNNPNDN